MSEKFDEMLRERARTEETPVPPATTAVMENTLQALPSRTSSRRRTRLRLVARAAAIAAAVIVLLPNLHPALAEALGKVPVIGSVFRVVTVRKYQYDDGMHSGNAEVPEITADGNTAVAQSAKWINADVKALTDELVSRFEADAKDIGKDGHTALDISYTVVTNTNRWFTLKLTVWEGAGSSNTYYKFYHMDKTTGATRTLADMFEKDFDYVAAISENIRQQMVTQMRTGEGITYWVNQTQNPSWNFYSIDERQNFYFNAAGDLVIVFDKYAVAPGAMGCPEFVIPQSVYAGKLAAH